MDCPGLFLLAQPGTGESVAGEERSGFCKEPLLRAPLPLPLLGRPLLLAGIFAELVSDICLLIADSPLAEAVVEFELEASGLGVEPLLVGLWLNPKRLCVLFLTRFVCGGLLHLCWFAVGSEPGPAVPPV